MSLSKSGKAPDMSVTEAVKQMEHVASAQRETIGSAVKTGADVATQTVDKVLAFSREQSESFAKSSGLVFRSYGDFFRFGKDNLDAFIKSGSIIARGIQDLSRSMVSFSQESYGEMMASGQSVFSAKSLQDSISMSSAMVTSNIDRLISEGNKVGQFSSKLVGEAIAPLNNRVDAAFMMLAV